MGKPKSYGLYAKQGVEVHARQCLASENFIVKNRLFTTRPGQWIVKPVDGEEKPWEPVPNPYETHNSRKGIIEIPGAHLEEDHHFERDYEYIGE
jgi:hypothetical protein